MPAQPPSNSVRCHEAQARTWAASASGLASPPSSRDRAGRFPRSSAPVDASQARTSSRKAASSGVSSKSMSLGAARLLLRERRQALGRLDALLDHVEDDVAG